MMLDIFSLVFSVQLLVFSKIRIKTKGSKIKENLWLIIVNKILKRENEVQFFLKRMVWGLLVMPIPAAFPKLASKSEVFPLHQG